MPGKAAQGGKDSLGKNGLQDGTLGGKAEAASSGNWKLLLPVFVVAVGIGLHLLQTYGSILQETVKSKVWATHQVPLPARDDTIDVSGPTCGAEQFLSSYTIHGFHMLCLEKHSKSLDVTVFVDGKNETMHFSTPWESNVFKGELSHRLDLDIPGKDPPNKFAWAMYTPDGRKRIETIEEALSSRLVFVFKGGNFIWPGVRVGFTRRVHHLETLGSIEMRTLSMVPLIFEMKNFLTDHECGHIRDKASPHMKPSPVSLMDHDRGKDDTNWRTSKTHFMRSTGDQLLQGINQRVEDITRVPQGHQEHVQVLRYEVSERYTAHHDFFNPKLYQRDQRTLDNTEGGRKNRMITVFWYLSDVEEGGETIFPRAGGRTGPVDFSDCTIGLKVKPAEGKVAMFYSMRPDGQFDDFSLHGACPVTSGRKWAANKWVWTAPVNFGGR